MTIGLIVAACASPVPTPTASVARAPVPTRSTTPSPTAGPTPAPSPTPEIVCGSGPVIGPLGGSPSTEPTGTLTCENAIEAAVAALPADGPPILRIAFHYGRYCPPGYFCALSLGINEGYVVLFLRDDTVLWVPVRADSAGTVSLEGAPEPYPPSG